MTYGGGGGGGGLGGDEILIGLLALGFSDANLTLGKFGFGLAECAWADAGEALSLLEAGREGGGVGFGVGRSGGDVGAFSIFAILEVAILMPKRTRVC